MTKAPPKLYGDLHVTMPPVHDGQLEVLRDPSRMKLLRAGRRFRKSSTGVIQAFSGYGAYLGALTGGHIGWWVPSLTSRYLVADWEPIKGLTRQIPGTRIEEANHRVIMPTGGSILMLSADNPDSGRGLGLDGAVIDEASLIAEVVWPETIRPALSDRRGWALFLFTPKGMNWIHDLELEAAEQSDWRAFHFPSAANPYIDPGEIEVMRREMSSAVYRQEIEAEYVSGGAGMFDSSWFRYWWPEQSDGGLTTGYHLGEQELVAVERCWRFATVDLAWSLEERADYTVIATWDVTPLKHLVLVDLVRGRFEGPEILRRIRGAYDLWKPGYVGVERATKQLGIVRDLEASGLPVRELRADRSKESRALPATARMENGSVWFPKGAPWLDDLKSELLAFPMGRHDDQVDVLSYACLELATFKPPKESVLVGF